MLMKLFLEQVQKNPEQIAVKTESSILTYGELEKRARKIGQGILREAQDAEEVALLFQQGPDMIVGTVATLMAGKVYIPFDATYPVKRILHMLKDSGTSLLITNTANLEKAQAILQLSESDVKIINMDEMVDMEWDENLEAKENELAYILYTSGSTGNPKGVLQSQENALYFIRSYSQLVGISSTDRLTLFSNFGHDAAILDIFGGLLNGATLYPVNIKESFHPDLLARWLLTEKITIWHSVPTFFSRFTAGLEAGKHDFVDLRYIVLGGESLREHDIRSFKKFFSHSQLINLYGQSESSFDSAQLIEVDQEVEKITLGEPIDGTKMMLIDDQGRPVASLRTGEIVIVSPHIALGYWKKEEATKKAFGTHPKLGRLYWTGDLGRLLLDGRIEFMGRKDFQVKIRGYRIELGDIESHLLKHPDLLETVVVGREDHDGEMCLCAYYVAKREISQQELRTFLSQELPFHMIPTYWLSLEEIPLTGTGKIDRGALPDIIHQVAQAEYVAPSGEVEEQLAAIWEEVLGVEQIGVDDDFFHLGGHSLKAAAVVAKAFEKMEVEILLGDIFKYPTIRQLAERIGTAEKSIYTSLEPIEAQDHYPVSSAQRRMFVLNQLDELHTSYNMPKILTVQGPLAKERVEEAVAGLIQRHETLRTSFDVIDGEILQIVHPGLDFHVTYTEGKEADIPEIVEEFIQPFDLRKAPLLRVQLVKLAAEKHLLLFDMHHIISDGTSVNLLIRDFVALYEGKELAPLRIQYKDFSDWQNQLFASEAIESQENYWLDIFANEPPVLNLPTDYPRPAKQSFEGSNFHFTIESPLTEKLYSLARKERTTLFMVLLAAYNLLLAKYSGQEDVVVGTPIAGRSHNDLQPIIGMFINTLALRNKPEADKTFTAFLQEVKENALQGYENQDYQFERLVKKLNIARDLSRNPLFDTMLILHNNEKTELALEGLTFSLYPWEGANSKLDITLNAVEWDDQIHFNLEYCTRLFKRETMERFMAHYQQILSQVVSEPTAPLADIQMILPTEREQIMGEFNATQTEFPKELTIHERIALQAAKRPDDLALVFLEQKMTYGELNNRANQLARLLIEKGVQPDTMVAIMVERSLEMMVGLLAILKSGAAYLPIDPDYPKERIRYVFTDSQIQIVLTGEKFYDQLASMGVEAIRIDEEAVYQGETTDLEPISTPNNLAYMIYTSGSTGKPKGVMVEHRAVNNFITGINQIIPFTPEESILALTTISFDIFGLETLLPLTQGSRVVIANDEEQKDTKALYRAITKNRISMLQMTPSRMRMLLNDDYSRSSLKEIKVIMLGGESLPLDLLEEVKELSDARIYNMYGPTETTIWSTVKELTREDRVTIGLPIANTGVYILGQDDQLQPLGVPGELCITGEGLARGYWQRPDLTAEKFVLNPYYAPNNDEVGSEKMYRTGDLARWLPGGDIELLGRMDDQVKIRGFRIEPGEIENRLMSHESVQEVVVVSRPDTSGGKYLCAYLVGEEELHIPALKAHLSERLPDYMIPTYFIQIDQMPYTPNGKIDRKALPKPDAGMVSGVEYLAPSNEIEEKLIKIWEEVLGISGIGVQHNFFDIGGNSINIIKVINLISKRMGVEVPMSELFLRPTVAEIARNMFIESPLKGLECVVSLNRPVEGKKNVFIIHTWEGIIYQYKEIARLLEGEYNVYGIQAKGVMNPAILPETLEEMITDYLVEMKTIQPEGPYIIAGYCYGNWIAYKMVQMLEERDVEVERMIQIDENSFMPDKIRRYYRMRTELTRPYRFVRRLFRKAYYKLAKKNPMDYWPDLEEYKKTKPKVEGEIRNEMTVRENVNRLCTVGYTLQYLVSVDTYIIKAEENNLVRYTKEDWERLTMGKVWFEEIPGGHESIFNYPYVEELARTFKRTLEE